MSFLRAARAALAGQSCFRRILVAMVIVLAGLSLSCGSGYSRSVPSHNAYVTLPANGSVLLLHINGATGAITVGGETPRVENTTPRGLALIPSKKFLYAVNSDPHADSISIFNVASDGTLTLSGAPTPAGSSPNAAVIDPSGKYLLVTNSSVSDGTISVFSIDPTSGALSPFGLPVSANSNPTEILITPSGKFVYVTNPGLGMVTAFTFSGGVLTQVTGSPFSSLPAGGGGASGLAVDGSEGFLYVANPSASNPLQSNTGNISGFNIQPDGPNAGALTPILGSPFTSTVGNGPSAITVDPRGQFVYAVTAESSSSVWCFAIAPSDGKLKAVTNSPFSLTAGILFAIIDPSGNYFYIGGTGIAGYTYSPSTGVPTPISGSPFSTGTAPGKMVFSE